MFHSEITKGDVIINNNNELCHIDSVKWTDIFEESSQKNYTDASTLCKYNAIQERYLYSITFWHFNVMIVM